MTERDKKIINMYQNGISAKNIAKEMKVSEGTVFRVIRINNIPKHKKTIELTSDDEQKICSLYTEYNSLLSIQEKFNISYERVIKILEKNNIQLTNSRSKIINHNLDENYFENIDTPDKAYWLGWLISDGCINNNKIQLTISQQDEHILKILEKDLKVENKIYLKNNYSSFSLGSKKLCEDLSKWSIIPNKTFTVSIPDLNNNLYPHLLRGLFDGDGGISVYKRSNGQINYELGITGNKQVVEKVKKILESNIPDLTKKDIEPNGRVYRIRWGAKKDIILLREYLYKDHNNHYLIRKYEKMFQLC